jgi:hypothetical protein
MEILETWIWEIRQKVSLHRIRATHHTHLILTALIILAVLISIERSKILVTPVILWIYLIQVEVDARWFFNLNGLLICIRRVIIILISCNLST